MTSLGPRKPLFSLERVVRPLMSPASPLPCLRARCVQMEPEEFVFNLTLQDPPLRDRYYRSLLRPLLWRGYAEPRCASQERFEELLILVANHSDATELPSAASCAAAVARWRRSALARWMRHTASRQVASAALRLYPPSEVPRAELVPQAEAAWARLLAGWRPAWTLAPELLEPFLEELEPLDAPASQQVALRFLSATSFSAAPPPPAPASQPPDAPPLAPEETRALLRLFRKALVLGSGSLAEARDARDLTPQELPDLREALPEGAWLEMAGALLDLAPAAKCAEHLATGADGLLQHAELLRSKNVGVVDWVLEKWRKICAEAMAKWRPHDPKGSFKGVPALTFLYYGHRYAPAPEGGPPAVRKAAALPEELLPELLAHLEERLRAGTLDGAPTALELLQAVAHLQTYRLELLAAGQELGESLRSGEAVVRAAFDALAEEAPNYGAAYAELMRHPESCGLSADLEAYEALATDSTLGLLSRLAVFLEEQLAQDVYVAFGSDLHHYLWRDFVRWSRRPEPVRSLLPPEAANLRIKEKCSRCRGPASRHGVFERSRDEGQRFYLVCDSPECGHVARS